jgi:hypothetical protein
MMVVMVGAVVVMMMAIVVVMMMVEVVMVMMAAVAVMMGVMVMAAVKEQMKRRGCECGTNIQDSGQCPLPT